MIEKCEDAFQIKHYLGSPPILMSPILGETLYLYLTVTIQISSVVLFVEREKVQHSVYYVNQTLISA